MASFAVDQIPQGKTFETVMKTVNGRTSLRINPALKVLGGLNHNLSQEGLYWI